MTSVTYTKHEAKNETVYVYKKLVTRSYPQCVKRVLKTDFKNIFNKNNNTKCNWRVHLIICPSKTPHLLASKRDTLYFLSGQATGVSLENTESSSAKLLRMNTLPLWEAI